MKKTSTLVFIFICLIYRITIGQTIDAPVFKNAEGVVNGCSNGNLAQKEIGYLGVMSADNANSQTGLLVEIVENGPAFEAGLRGEVLVFALDGQKIANWNDLETVMGKSKPGDRMVVDFEKDGKSQAQFVLLTKKRAVRSFHRCSDETPKKHYRVDDGFPQKPACLGVFGKTGWAETNTPDGTKVTDLVVKGPAEKSGIAIGDVIMSVDGVPVETFSKLYKTIAEYAPGDIVKIDFLRNDKRFSVEATLNACYKTTVDTRSKLDKVVVKWPEAIKPQLPENQTVAPQIKLTLESFTAFPNPVSEEVTIRFSGEKLPVEISLVTANGQVLFSEKMENFDGQYDQQFDLRALPKGLVVFSVKQNGKVFSEEILVQ